MISFLRSALTFLGFLIFFKNRRASSPYRIGVSGQIGFNVFAILVSPCFIIVTDVEVAWFSFHVANLCLFFGISKFSLRKIAVAEKLSDYLLILNLFVAFVGYCAPLSYDTPLSFYFFLEINSMMSFLEMGCNSPLYLAKSSMSSSSPNKSLMSIFK